MLMRLEVDLRPPTDEDTFEELVRDLLAREWSDPNTERVGRRGQKQGGVDVYGRPVDGNLHRGAQAKLRNADGQLSEKDIRSDVASARSFDHELDELIFMTTAPRDRKTQAIVERIDAEQRKSGGFRVSLRSWDRIREQIAAHPDLMVKYYRGLFAALTTNARLDQLIHQPITIDIHELGNHQLSRRLSDLLKLRGIRTNLAGINDGVVLHLADDANVIEAVAKLVNMEEGTPYFVVLPDACRGSFGNACNKLGIEVARLTLLSSDGDLNEVANHIFDACFEYGYGQRGRVSTLEAVVRQRQNLPSSALVDLDWHGPDGGAVPDDSSWQELEPALEAVAGKLAGVRDNARITLESHLAMPLAVAVGFHLNVRIAKLGVWTRRKASSRFEEKFWRSDANVDEVDFEPHWFSRPTGVATTAVLELSTIGSIHADIEGFLHDTLTPDVWLELQLERRLQDTRNITETQAVSYAERVGQLARELRSQGVQDFHLFLRMPSALAVLVGQRLLACGRLHLYWYTNPSYKPAFVLS